MSISIIIFLFLHEDTLWLLTRSASARHPLRGTPNENLMRICFHGETRGPWARNRSPGFGWSWYVTLCHGDYLGYQMRLPLAIQNLMLFEVSRLSPWLPSWILEQNDLAILNLHVTMMPPIKFQLNLTYCLRRDVVWRISRWRPFWKLEQNYFSNSEFP